MVKTAAFTDADVNMLQVIYSSKAPISWGRAPGIKFTPGIVRMTGIPIRPKHLYLKTKTDSAKSSPKKT